MIVLLIKLTLYYRILRKIILSQSRGWTLVLAKESGLGLEYNLEGKAQVLQSHNILVLDAAPQ